MIWNIKEDRKYQRDMFAILRLSLQIDIENKETYTQLRVDFQLKNTYTTLHEYVWKPCQKMWPTANTLFSLLGLFRKILR